jgi:hypothetical protein
LALALASTTVLASEPLLLDSAEPTSLEELRGRTEQVLGAGAAGQCGGITSESVGFDLGEGTAAVTGLPGRYGQPLAAPRSGLALKYESGGELDDGFQFPDESVGLSTRCEPNTDKLVKIVMSYDELTRGLYREIEAPSFGDPPCLTTGGDCQNFCEDLNDYTYPDCAVVYGDMNRGIGCAVWCMKETCTDGWTDRCSTSLSELTGGELPDSPQPAMLSLYKGGLVFEKDGQFVWYDSLDPVYNDDGEPISFGETEEYVEPLDLTPPAPAYPNCVACRGPECRCGLQPVPEESSDPVCLLQVPEVDVGKPSMVNLPENVLWDSCRGAGLRRLEAEGDDEVPPGPVISLSDCEAAAGKPEVNPVGGVYASFYRLYQAAAARRAYTEVAPQDMNEAAPQAACYGFYNEFDPLVRRTKTVPAEYPEDGRDARCVVGLESDDMPQTQAGMGQLPEQDPDDPFTTFARDAGLSPWFQGLAAAFSLLHASDDANRDTLPQAVLTLPETDRAGLRALPELHRATMADFDESGERRIITTWWASLEQVMAEALAEPRVNVLFPKLPDLAPGADDPLFDEGIPEHPPATDPTAPFEVQLGVGEDLVGRVAAFLQKDVVLRVEQDDVPTLVPEGEPEDWRALAQGWCTYLTRPEIGAQGCDFATLQGEFPEAAAFMQRLEEYASRIEEAAELRAELTKTLAGLLQARSASLQAIEQWKLDAAAVLSRPEDQAERLRALRERWAEVSREYAAVGAVTNMPWCMNQRFTSPITSLLDPWLPSRQGSGGVISGAGLPLPFFRPRPPDIELDLSLLHLQEGSVSVPVLKPLQVRFDLVRLAPPGSAEEQTTEPPELPAFPDLQPIKDALAAARQSLADVEVLSEPPLPEVPEEFLPAAREEELAAALDGTEEIIQGMDDAYRRFWEPLLPENRDDRLNLACQGWGLGACKWTEMELIEELTRAMSPPGAFRPEDLAPMAPLGRSTSPACELTDGACLPLPPVLRPPQSGWQIAAPTDDDGNLDELRRTVRETLLPDEIDPPDAQSLRSIPWISNGPDLLPGLAVPAEIPLLPPASSSSAS